MSVRQWLESNVEYVCDLANSGLEGAGRGRDEFLEGEDVAPFLAEAARQAVTPALVGAYLGALGAVFSGKNSNGKRPSATRTLTYCVLGGAIGFGAGLAWKTQGLTANIARRSLENTRPVRDERWFERHPINYA
jgi:hypothetical protein